MEVTETFVYCDFGNLRPHGLQSKPIKFFFFFNFRSDSDTVFQKRKSLHSFLNPMAKSQRRTIPLNTELPSMQVCTSI
jgi:hypothetical protein